MIKKFFKIILVFFTLILSWLICAWILPNITVKNNDSNLQKTIAIYVKSNGIHTDIVVPLKNSCYDCMENRTIEDIQEEERQRIYLN